MKRLYYREVEEDRGFLLLCTGRELNRERAMAVAVAVLVQFWRVTGTRVP